MAPGGADPRGMKSPTKEPLVHIKPPSPAGAVNRSSYGPLVQANSHRGVAIFTGYDLRPGASRTATVRIANAGPAPAHLRLEEIGATSDFGAELTMTIEDVTAAAAPVYTGAFGELPAGGIYLGRFEVGEERIYRFIATLAAEAAQTGNRGAGGLYEWEAGAVSAA